MVILISLPAFLLFAVPIILRFISPTGIERPSTHELSSHTRRLPMRTSGIVFLVVLLIGCGKKEVSFRTDIQPLLNNRCVQCHGADKPAGKVMLTSYESLMSATVSRWKKPVVVPGNPGDSWLYLRTGTTQPHFRMPPDTLSVVPLTEKEIEMIGKWIMQGAKNN